MIPIYVCEDDPIQAEHVVDTIEKSIMINNYHCSLQMVTEKPLDLLNDVKQNQYNFAVFFLDIELDSQEISGIELASKLKTINPNFKMVFISSHVETALLIHKMNIEAFDFIVKETPSKVTEDIRRVLMKLFSNELNSSITNDVIKLSFDDEVLFFPINDIQYFCTIPGSPHKLEVHLINEQFQFYGHLKQIVKQHDNLKICHKSFVVNRNNIKSINKKTRLITKGNGEKIPLSILGVKNLLSN